ncbi:exodeoxyribonuclease V subunit beta [soil metagenome]
MSLESGLSQASDHASSTDSQPLVPLSFPLWGSRLIEASAGTGKTYTIAALYLRLVLGHGDEATAFGRPLVPSEILVMTFTRAATRELSARIRKRLIEAAACFRGEAEPGEGDVLLTSLMDDYPEGEGRSMAAWHLAMAADAMDDAAVHTIDAWCQRMLREHAFDSGNLFDEELMANEKDMLEEAARDYWRQQVYPLSEGALAGALTVWPSVDRLIKDVQQLLWHSQPEHAEEPNLETVLHGTLAERSAALAELKQGWDERAEEMRAWIEDQLQRSDCPFKKSKLQANHYNRWLDGLKAWALDAELEQPDISPTGMERFTPQGLRDICDPVPAGTYRASLKLHAHFEGFSSLMRSLGRLPDPGRSLRLHATACVVARLDALKRQAGTYGFKDLVDRLDAALRGPNAENLRRRIVEQYPVALVDEFQDTSPTQYAIFDSLYGTAANDRNSALFLIGDPKQSIYAFRGADIASYLKARRATAGRHYMLGTNFRSTPQLVNAVNHVFARAEQRDGPGAFMFRRRVHGGGVDNPVPFEPVDANGRPDTLVDSSGPLPSLRLVHDSATASKGASQRRFAERCAEDIAQLLNAAGTGFTEEATAFRRLMPGDIAVLVRDRFEAEAVRRELRSRGVASVYLSDQDSVFESREAHDLMHWLRAVEQPQDMRLARAALATQTIGLSLAEMAVLAADDEAFEVRAEQIRALNVIWQRQGVLTMLRQTLHMFDLPSRWLAEQGGERRLTNYLHLAEMIQVAAGKLDGEQALIHWLRDQIEGDASTGDERVVRLESDADLVQVISVHKSKGLEYPLVYVPFVCAFRAVERRGRHFVALSDDEGTRTLDFGPSDEGLAAADLDRLREDLRLLYVAVTRAQHSLWLGVGSIGSGKLLKSTTHKSAIGYLLAGGELIEGAELKQRLIDVYGNADDIELIDARGAATGRTRLQPRGDDVPLHDAPAYDASFEKDWSVGSFSAMVRHIAHLPPGQVTGDVAREEELLAEPLEAEPSARSASQDTPWHRFPRGAMPGNFLHDQLEWLAGEGFGLRESEDLQQQLQRRCERQGWGHRSDDVVVWLSALTHSPLGGVGATLAGLGAAARGAVLPEMEFWFPSEGLDSTGLDSVCSRYLLAGRPRAALPLRVLQGMLMGFCDLVFEHEGRYWVLDYKSNSLGDRDADYHRQALEGAMAQHRYDLQAALYLLALHRLLRQRLGDAYDPATQLGGAVYLFLRGFNGPARGSYVVPADPAFLDAMDELVGYSDREREPS